MNHSPALPFQIKICGLTLPQQALDAREAGADAIGLNFFESSIRFVSPQQAAVIAAAARGQAPNQTNPATRVVGVFVNHSLEQILKLATNLQLDGIQLHGDETVDFFTELKNAFVSEFSKFSKFESTQIPFFVRALRTQPSGDQSDVNRGAETDRITRVIQSWADSGIDTVLLDAAATGEFGGTGKSIDWSRVPELQASAARPLALAGGLNPSNVAQAIEIAQVNMVDVASGVESPTGVKCSDKVREFVLHARRALDAARR